MKFALKVLPKPEVLDTQGRAVEGTLKDHGFKLQACRVGTYIVLDVDSSDENEATEMAKAMAEKGLYNPLIENYELEKL
ncbi:MAG: phosphoribosylformylglycinamidine synthase subunit PurS [Bdellovibrionales bacterium]|nr:phosphoribosylformylglycinamidine synthase subunit PurS [Bdellovibrionales bacterium]NQZ19717.1 phosphoribosylformylglycinamidine synthase subunit PurS [Bdellovibrionales bacterium]